MLFFTYFSASISMEWIEVKTDIVKKNNAIWRERCLN